MSDPGKQFPWIRVFGTLGWIVAGLMIGKLQWEKTGQTGNTFYLAAGASALLGLLSFFLPDTPPKASAGQASAAKVLGTEAFILFKNRCLPDFFYSRHPGLYPSFFLLWFRQCFPE